MVGVAIRILLDALLTEAVGDSEQVMYPAFLANVAGSFLMGVVRGFSALPYLRNYEFLEEGLTSGLCGSLTTYSSWMAYAVILFASTLFQQLWFQSIALFLLVIFIGLSTSWFSFSLAFRGCTLLGTWIVALDQMDAPSASSAAAATAENATSADAETAEVGAPVSHETGELPAFPSSATASIGSDQRNVAGDNRESAENLSSEDIGNIHISTQEGSDANGVGEVIETGGDADSVANCPPGNSPTEFPNPSNDRKQVSLPVSHRYQWQIYLNIAVSYFFFPVVFVALLVLLVLVAVFFRDGIIGAVCAAIALGPLGAWIRHYLGLLLSPFASKWPLVWPLLWLNVVGTLLLVLVHYWSSPAMDAVIFYSHGILSTSVKLSLGTILSYAFVNGFVGSLTSVSSWMYDLHLREFLPALLNGLGMIGVTVIVAAPIAVLMQWILQIGWP